MTTTTDKPKLITRTMSLPVLRPLNGEWPALWKQLHSAWRGSTGVANWIISAIYAADRAACTGPIEKLPPLSDTLGKLNTYRMATAKWPELPTNAISALDRMCRRKYLGKNADGRQVRWACMTGLQSVPSFRYPAPYPMAAGKWRFAWGRGGEPIVKVLLDRSEERWELQLKSGSGFRRQLAGLRRAMELDSIATLSLSMRNKRLMANISIGLPPEEAAGLEGDLVVRTVPDSLLVACAAGSDRREWFYHGDQLRKWVAEHSRRLGRLSDDRKAERVLGAAAVRVQEQVSDRQHRRLDTATHQIAAAVVGYALRRRLARIVLDDSERAFLPAFCWHQVSERIRNVAAARGVAIVTAEALRKLKHRDQAALELAAVERSLIALIAQPPEEVPDAADSSVDKTE
jgi:hypothetical protein